MKFFVIGIDDNQHRYFKPEVEEVIRTHRVFSGGARHHDIVKSFLPEGYDWIPVTVPLKNVFEQYLPYDEIVVFASGDPLFFGFAQTIRRELPEAEIKLYPYFNTLQLLAHRLLMPYQDMHVVSLTGRPWDKFDEALICGYDTIGVLTDHKEHTPSAIARRMLEYGYDNYRMSIGELLGNADREKVATLPLSDVVDREFLYPNNLILHKTHIRKRPFGIPDGDFRQLEGRPRMITKMPARLLSLSLLELNGRNVLWDVGFCTGSVSVEAKLHFPHLRICAFEIREEGRELMQTNTRRFGTPGIQTIIGDFLEADHAALPSPDAVFIGGHGGRMADILSRIHACLRPGGVIVFNSVSPESRQLFIESLNDNGFTLLQEITIQVDHFNTLTVMKGGTT